MGLRHGECARQSFISLCEQLIPEPRQRKPLQRIFSIMRRRGAVRYLLHDDLQNEPYFPKQYPAAHRELEDIQGRHPNVSVSATQITFFSDKKAQNVKALLKPVSPTKARGSGGSPRVEILGTCLLIHLRSTSSAVRNRDFVFEALISLPTSGNTPNPTGVSSHIHVFSKAEFPVAGRIYNLGAAFYSQQNQLLSSCAHCCVKMALWHLGEGEYQVPTGEINTIAARSYVPPPGDAQPFDPGAGLQREQILKVCDHFKADTLVVHFGPNPSSNASDAAQPNAYAERQLATPYELAYLLAESGLPTLILFQSTRHGDDYHMTPVIGHTLSADEWLPHAMGYYDQLPTDLLHGKPHDYISTVEWAPHLIMHDDLMGPYYFVAPNILTAKPPGDPGEVNNPPQTVGRVHSVIAVVEKGSGRNRSPIFAQEIASKFFWALWEGLTQDLPPDWVARLKRRWNPQSPQCRRDVVLRTQIVEPKRYAAHLRDIRDHLGHGSKLSDADERYVATHLWRPNANGLWMVEFTLPELFSGNLSKLGEIVIPLEWADPAVALELIALKAGDPLPKLPLAMRLMGNLCLYDQQKLSRTIQPLGFRSHVPLYIRTPD